MFVKLLGENENGFPLDCTVGKVYEIADYDEDGSPWFIDDLGDEDFAYDPINDWSMGDWQVVDKNGEAV